MAQRRGNSVVGPGWSDQDLILTFSQEGNPDAFAELVRRWDRPIFQFLARNAGDTESAKDLRQDVFVRVYRHAGSYDPAFAFSTWIMRIALNVLRTWQGKESLRSRRMLPTDEPEFVASYDPSTPASTLADAERTGGVRLALNALPPSDRELLLMRFQLELNYREIGEVLRLPETTVKSRVYSILNRLRRPLARFAEIERSSPI